MNESKPGGPGPEEITKSVIFQIQQKGEKLMEEKNLNVKDLLIE